MASRAQARARSITFLEIMVYDIPRLMKLYKGTADLGSPPERAVATIGNFDGVHIGHQELVRLAKEHANRIAGTVVAVTFRPHPHFVIRPTNDPYLINTYEEKAELLSQYGAGVILELPFSREFSNTAPEEFVDRILVERLGVQALYLGYDFAFGKERAGSVEVMERLAKERGIEAHVVPPQKADGKVVSSSLVRKLLQEGEMESVRRCLGRLFFLKGLVWRGEGRGRTIGFPTANLQTENRLYPRPGVYATKTLWRNRWHRSVSNIGYNPTFKGDGSDLPLKVETHILDFSEDLYGDEIRVEFLKFLRTEKKFGGVEALLEQIRIDVQATRASPSEG